MDDNNFKQLNLLIKEVFGIEDITLNTEINMLNTVSEDNDYFINSFKTNFNVNMSNFDYYEYFKEDEFIMLSILRRLFEKKKKKKVITVAHLLLVIDKGKWFEPECSELRN